MLPREGVPQAHEVGAVRPEEHRDRFLAIRVGDGGRLTGPTLTDRSQKWTHTSRVAPGSERLTVRDK